MKDLEQDKPNNFLNEYSYEQLKISNEIAFGILTEYIDGIYAKIFSDKNKYITNMYQLRKLLERIEFLGKRNYQEVKYCLDLSENEAITKNDGAIEIYRYYYADAGTIIFNSVYYKERLLKVFSKRMLKFLTAEGKKERDKIKKIASTKFRKLQKDLFYVIDNDPTLEDTEDGKITD